MAVRVTRLAPGVAPRGRAVALFTLQSNSSWDVSPDGQRFLVNTSVENVTTPPITVVLNWKPKR
jgi:hypothetical protein